jgi:hypothetical protein
MRRFVCLLALMLLTSFILPGKSFGQSVRYDNVGYNMFLRSFERAAKDQGAPCWPLIPKGQAGTWALVTFDTQNCDITFVTRRRYPASSLLANTQTVARLSKLPLANYIIKDSLHTRGVDLELNPYLIRSRFHTRLDVPLGQITDAIGKAGFPTPIAVAVDATGSTACNLTSLRHITAIDKYWFAAQTDIPADSHINFDAHLTWRSWVNAAVVVAVALLVIATFVGQFRRGNRKTTSEPEVFSSAEAQRRYDKSPPRWTLLLLPVLPIALVPVITMMSNHSVTVFSFLSPEIHSAGLFLPIFVLLAQVAVRTRQNNRKAGALTDKAHLKVLSSRQTIDRKIFFIPLGALLPMITLAAFVTFNPPLNFRQARIDHLLLYACYAVGFSLLAYFMYRTTTAFRVKKTPAPEP